MKVRLVKKDNLMKAANRANLVKVAVQVNGRTGQYSSHRWKNPNAALNVLKETMKRAGVKTTDELEFKSKKTKKVVDEEQLIADYKESKTTDTLQDFVKKNYTVLKADAKEPKGEKDNGRNESEIPNPEKYPNYAGRDLRDYVNKQGINIRHKGSYAYIKFPYNEYLVDLCRNHDGRWNPDAKEWRVPIEREKSLREHFLNYADWDDKDNDYVVLKYTMADLSGGGDSRYLGTLKVLERPGRDYKVRKDASTDILSGEFGRSGGSVRHPDVLGDGISPHDIELMTVVHKKFYENLTNNYNGQFKGRYDVVWEGKVGEVNESDDEATAADEPNFLNVELDGSVKQNNWAQDIRRNFYDNYDNLMRKIDDAIESDDKSAKFKDVIQNYVEHRLEDTSSKNWIDSRNHISEREILNSATRFEAFARSQFNSTLPEIDSRFEPIEGGDEALEEVRKRVVSTSSGAISEMLTRISGYPGEEKLKPDQVDYIDYVIGMFDNTNKAYWERAKAFDDTLRKNDLFSKYDSAVKIRKLQEHGLPKIVDDLASNVEGSNGAENKRMDLYAKLIRAQKLIKKRESGESGVHFKEVEGLDKDSIEKAKEIFESSVALSYWNKVSNDGIDTIQDLLKANTTEANLQDYDVIFRNKNKRKREIQKERELRLKDAIRVDANGDYEKVSSYGQLKDNLSALKGSNMEVIGRAAMDMVGIEAPLYVMKDRTFALDGSSALGYCEYDWTDYEKGNNVREIGVSDFKRHQQESFKTSIHESMHGVLGNLIRSDGNPVAASLPRKNHEGIVEIIGQGTTKAVYGDEYKKPLPSYIRFVVDTALRLRGLDEFKGKSIHTIGEALGEKAVAKDTKYFEELSTYLHKNKRVGFRGNVLNELLKNDARLDSAGERGHKRSDYGPYEKSDMASLVEQLKAGLISIQAALNSSKYEKAAIVLLYSLLEEDEDVEATLSAFQ